MIKTKKIGRVQWLDVQDPDTKELKHLKNKYHFHPLDLEDCRSLLQRPKVEMYKPYRFAILQVPMHHHGSKRMNMTEIDVFWSDSYIVTVHLGEISLINDLIKKLHKEKYQKKLGIITGQRLFFELSNELVSQIFPRLSRFRSEIDNIDKNMFSPNSREIVEDINEIRRELILSQTNIRQLVPVYGTLESVDRKSKDPIVEYWGEILDKLNKIKDEYEDFQELVEGLNDSLESILNHRTNEIIKTLTLFSVIMLPLTFITGFYGMNIEALPFARTHEALIVISSIMFCITIGMFIYFKVKRWL